jgi:secreted protein with Ig-like and vWFA domain
MGPGESSQIAIATSGNSQTVNSRPLTAARRSMLRFTTRTDRGGSALAVAGIGRLIDFPNTFSCRMIPESVGDARPMSTVSGRS